MFCYGIEDLSSEDAANHFQNITCRRRGPADAPQLYFALRSMLAALVPFPPAVFAEIRVKAPLAVPAEHALFEFGFASIALEPEAKVPVFVFVFELIACF